MSAPPAQPEPAVAQPPEPVIAYDALPDEAPPFPEAPKSEGCRIEVVLGGHTVCLDGPWLLTGSFLMPRQTVFFRRERRFFQLVPEFPAEELQAWTSRLTRPAEAVGNPSERLQLQAAFSGDTLVIEQQNPFSKVPETWRFQLNWQDGFFRGERMVLLEGGVPGKTPAFLLRLTNSSLLPAERSADEDPDF